MGRLRPAWAWPLHLGLVAALAALLAASFDLDPKEFDEEWANWAEDQ